MILLSMQTDVVFEPSLLNFDVVMNTPFRARLPCRAPANFWISGRPTVLPSFHRFAWT